MSKTIPSLKEQSPFSEAIEDRYESIFKIYKENEYLFFNILNKVVIPDNIDDSIIGTIIPNNSLPWTTLSFQIYNNIHLWWIIFLLNRPENIFVAEAGVEYKYILPEFVGAILQDIQSQISR
jgi:hypothetical protein